MAVILYHSGITAGTGLRQIGRSCCTDTTRTHTDLYHRRRNLLEEDSVEDCARECVSRTRVQHGLPPPTLLPDLQLMADFLPFISRKA